jgi:hypothetical protein
MDHTRKGVRVFISYSHDSEEHRSNVLDLTQLLRAHGTDAWIDQFDEASPPLSWPQWMHDQIEAADYVLLMITETYLRRFQGRETPGRGIGVRWEGAIVTSELYHSESDRVKFIPVVVTSTDARFIPAPLSLTNRYEVGTPGKRDIAALLRHLLGQPAAIPTPLGALPRLSDASIADDPQFEPIEEALRTAATGKLREAESQLQSLIDHPDRRIGARAAYTLGSLLQEDERFAAAITAYRRALDFGPRSGVADMAARNLQVTVATMDAHFGPGSAVDAAHQWLDHIKHGRIHDVWKGIHRTTRLVLQRHFVI